MPAFWPVTALNFGPLAICGYWCFGRTTSTQWPAENGLDQPPDEPGWAKIAVGVSHCGAGCTLGDIVAEPAVFVTSRSANVWLIRRGIKEAM